jgi:hypothetical protein
MEEVRGVMAAQTHCVAVEEEFLEGTEISNSFVPCTLSDSICNLSRALRHRFTQCLRHSCILLQYMSLNIMRCCYSSPTLTHS